MHRPHLCILPPSIEPWRDVLADDRAEFRWPRLAPSALFDAATVNSLLLSSSTWWTELKRLSLVCRHQWSNVYDFVFFFGNDSWFLARLSLFVLFCFYCVFPPRAQLHASQIKSKANFPKTTTCQFLSTFLSIYTSAHPHTVNDYKSNTTATQTNTNLEKLQMKFMFKILREKKKTHKTSQHLYLLLLLPLWFGYQK